MFSFASNGYGHRDDARYTDGLRSGAFVALCMTDEALGLTRCPPLAFVISCAQRTTCHARLWSACARCLELPGTVETTSFGHPAWKARRKAFAVFEKYRGDWSIALKADPGEQHALIEADARFYRTPYVGQHGWVSFKLKGRIPWSRLRVLLREAHRLID